MMGLVLFLWRNLQLWSFFLILRYGKMLIIICIVLIFLNIFVHTLINIFLFIVCSLYRKISKFRKFPVSILFYIPFISSSRRILVYLRFPAHFVYLGHVGIEVSPFYVVPYDNCNVLIFTQIPFQYISTGKHSLNVQGTVQFT